MERSELGVASPDRWLTMRAGLALVLANARYWPTVVPTVRAQLHRWEQHAQTIPDHSLRALALEKLRDEHFNSEVASTLAVTCPREYRVIVVEAIVAFEVMYDYLDGLTEQPALDPLQNGHQLFQAFTDAVTPNADLETDYYRYYRGGSDGDYLKALAASVKSAFLRLPASAAVTDIIRASAIRCATAQTRVHATPQMGATQLEDWAQDEARNTDLEWREFLAGAVASVLAVHALIAAASDQRTTPRLAKAIDTTYLSISALSTMLDSLIDYENDITTDSSWYLQHYDDHSLLATQLTHVARHAVLNARGLPNEAHHTMTLVGVVAYYTSAPAAANELAHPLVTHIHHELQPLITPTLAVMRTWRLAKRLRRRLPGRRSTTTQPPT